MSKEEVYLQINLVNAFSFICLGLFRDNLSSLSLGFNNELQHLSRVMKTIVFNRGGVSSEFRIHYDYNRAQFQFVYIDIGNLQCLM